MSSSIELKTKFEILKVCKTISRECDLNEIVRSQPTLLHNAENNIEFYKKNSMERLHTEFQLPVLFTIAVVGLNPIQ